MSKEYILTIHNELTKEYYQDLYSDLTEQELKDFGIDLSNPPQNSILREVSVTKSISGLKVENEFFGFHDCPIFINEWISHNVVFLIKSGEIGFDELIHLSNTRKDLGEYNLRVFLRDHIVENGEIVDNWSDEYLKRNLPIN
tara:strand:+ start:110 stop:535 length:426 start_codon:yes stop_codon:yes gene_type:complete